MKKLITFCLLAMAFTVNAQTKPTKEETVAYLDKIVKMSIGYKTYDTDLIKRANEKIITSYTFSESKINQTEDINDLRDGKSSRREAEELYNINWANIIKITTERNSLSLDPEIEIIRIEFSGNIFFNSSNMDNYQLRKDAWLIVLSTKAESVKKALLRLSEIAKEENKDPFAK